MFSIAAIFAVALSIVSTNDYTYTHPSVPSNSIIGVGIGKDGDYNIVRMEDVAFLHEAIAERADALGLFSTNSLPSASWIPRLSQVVNGGFSKPGILGLARYFSESFDSPYDAERRGEQQSFVAADFDFIRPSSTEYDCDENWIAVVPQRGTNDVRLSYMPYVATFGTRILPGEMLHTNSAASAILNLADLTNSYHNIDLCGRIATSPLNTSVPSGGSGTVDYTRNVIHYTYGKTSSSDQYGSWISGYDGNVTESYEVPQTLREPNVLPAFDYNEYTRSYSCAIGWRKTGDERDAGYNAVVLPTKLTASGSRSKAIRIVPDELYLHLITTNNTSLCSNLRVLIAVGIKRTKTETVDPGVYQGDASWTSNHVSRAWFVVDASKGWANYNGHPVYTPSSSLNLRLYDILDKFDPKEMPSDIYPNVSTIPATVNRDGLRLSELTATHTIRYTVSIEWLRVLYVFDRDYRAKAIYDD